MKNYTIFSLVILSIVSFVVLVAEDNNILVLEQYIRKLAIEAYRQLRNFDENLQPPYYDSLTWVDFEGRFYFDKKVIDEILDKRFYAYEKKLEPGTYYIVVTGYSSTVAQCGPNPFVTASGQKVRSGIVAANFLPFGTRLKIPEMFGDQVFEVQDRMAQRYWGRIDVWLPSYSQASRFGARRLKVEIL